MRVTTSTRGQKFSFTQIQSFSTSNSQIKSHSTIVSGADVKVCHGKSGGIYFYGTRDLRTMCLFENSTSRGLRRTSCFARRWESDADYAEVIIGLQVVLNFGNMLRKVIDSLEGIQIEGTRCVEIPNLGFAPHRIRAELKYAVRQVASIRPLFLAGLAEYVAAFIGGIGAWCCLLKG